MRGLEVFWEQSVDVWGGRLGVMERLYGEGV